MNSRVLYGFCRGCQKWVPRDEMIATNIRVYGEGIERIDDLIRLRLCPECHEREKRRWKTSEDGHSLEWEPTLRNEDEIRCNKELADKCDLIDYEGPN